MLLFVADGWIAAGFLFVWQIALFVSLGESVLAYGGGSPSPRSSVRLAA
jgi:hypothetical protein